MKKFQADKKIRYIVELQDDFIMPMTTINHSFCGTLENISSTNLYFKLNGCEALVIIPHNKVKWMAPSKVFWEKGFRYEDVF